MLPSVKQPPFPYSMWGVHITACLHHFPLLYLAAKTHVLGDVTHLRKSAHTFWSHLI
jgi:ABC-type Fe3+ transport system permease subunit